MNRKVAVVFPTGRSTIHDVVGMLADNLDRYNHNPKDINLIVSYDTTFYNLDPEDFVLDEDIERVFDSVTYLGPGDDGGLTERIRSRISERGYDILFKPRGYCSLKNRAIVSALRQGNDAIIFLDDDEYFVAPFKKEDGSLLWVPQDVFGHHVRNIYHVDITNGGHTGYFSPVPSEIEDELEDELRKELGYILSIGNEIINEKTFMNTRSCIIYGDEHTSNGIPYPIKEVNGIKFLTGGNIALNTESILSGRIPPYFNPRGSRGEDAIMGMQLRNTLVWKIPIYTFHDPFQKYVSITRGEFPESLEPIAVIPGTIERFAKAVEGWIRYAPLLIRMTSTSEGDYKRRIGSMRPIESIGKEIAGKLGYDAFGLLGDVLNEADESSYSDVEDLETARAAWKEILAGINIDKYLNV